MTKIDSSEYAFAETMKPADIEKPVDCKIKAIETVKTTYGDKRVLVFTHEKKDRQVFLNGISLRNLVNRFGDDTRDWLNQEVTIKVENSDLTQGKNAVIVE